VNFSSRQIKPSGYCLTSTSFPSEYVETSVETDLEASIDPEVRGMIRSLVLVPNSFAGVVERHRAPLRTTFFPMITLIILRRGYTSRVRREDQQQYW
jgi:hypothetical protein